MTWETVMLPTWRPIISFVAASAPLKSRLTLTRPSLNRDPNASWWFTNYKAAQGGEFTFRYSITSGRGLSDEALARFDRETRSPLVGYPFFDLGNVRLHPAKRQMPAASGSFFDIEASHAQVTAFKEAEDGNGYILRLRETAGKAGTARLASPVFPLASATDRK